jgi:hypothetical protein
VARIVKHPYFGARANFDYDFALIKMREPVTFNDYPSLRPVCLPDNEKTDADLFGLSGTVSGWGVVDPDQVQILSISISGEAVLEKAF